MILLHDTENIRWNKTNDILAGCTTQTVVNDAVCSLSTKLLPKYLALPV